MTEKYGAWTVAELKFELKKRKAKITGKKDALIERLIAYDRNNNFVDVEDEVEEINESMPWPSEITFDSVDHKSVIPQIDIVLINEYFLKVYNTLEGMSTFAAIHRKGYGMMQENFLSALVYALCNSHHYYRDQVNSEMTKNLTYFIKMIIDEEGEILEANCECVAGKGTKAACKHIATVVYAILHFRKHNKWCIRTTCTSNRQMWHMPKKSKIDICPKKSEDISFAVPEYSIQKKTKSNMCYDLRPDCFKNLPIFNDNVRNAVINHNSSRKRTLAISGTFDGANVAGIINDHDYLQRLAKKILMTLKSKEENRINAIIGFEKERCE